jgi:hypothetical protein
MSMQEAIEALNKRYHKRYGKDETTWRQEVKDAYDGELIVNFEYEKAKSDFPIDTRLAKLFYGPEVTDATKPIQMYKVADLEATKVWMEA